jgi:hypothetical protein
MATTPLHYQAGGGLSADFAGQEANNQRDRA